MGPWKVSGTSSISGPNLGNCGSTEAIFGRPGRPFMWQNPGASFCGHFGGFLHLENSCLFAATSNLSRTPLSSPNVPAFPSPQVRGFPLPAVLFCSANPSSRPGSDASLVMLGFQPPSTQGCLLPPLGSPCTLPPAPEAQRTFGHVCGHWALISSLLCSQTARSSCIRRPCPHQRVTSAVRFTCRLLTNSPHPLYAGSTPGETIAFWPSNPL